jgi:hypothetical protein
MSDDEKRVSDHFLPSSIQTDVLSLSLSLLAPSMRSCSTKLLAKCMKTLSTSMISCRSSKANRLIFTPRLCKRCPLLVPVQTPLVREPWRSGSRTFLPTPSMTVIPRWVISLPPRPPMQRFRSIFRKVDHDRDLHPAQRPQVSIEGTSVDQSILVLVYPVQLDVEPTSEHNPSSVYGLFCDISYSASFSSYDRALPTCTYPSPVQSALPGVSSTSR